MNTSTAVRCDNCQCEIDGNAKYCIYCGVRQPVREGDGRLFGEHLRFPPFIERASRKPILLEFFAFIIFGALVCALLWSMYGDLGLRPSPPRAPEAKPHAVAPHLAAPHAVAAPSPAAPEEAKAPEGKPVVRTWQTPGRKPPAHPGDHVTYHAGGAHWDVVSGYDGDNIFYQKSIISRDHTSTFLMEYPKSEKAKYQKANEKLAHAFHG